MRKFAGYMIAVSLLALTCSACLNGGRNAGETMGLAPSFEVKDLDGKVHRLSDYRDKVVLVNFWATWCPPCRAEIPDFIQAYNEHKNSGLVILGLSLDRLTPAQLRSYVRQARINYPVAFGTEEMVRDFEPGQYIPTTIVIDKKGKIRDKHVGILDKAAIDALFQRLMAE